MMRVFRVPFEIGGLLNDVAGTVIGVVCVVVGYLVDQFWFVPLGAIGIAISLYRFSLHLSQWRCAKSKLGHC